MAEPGKDEKGKTVIGRPPYGGHPIGNQDRTKRGLGKTEEDMKAERAKGNKTEREKRAERDKW